MSRKGCSPDKAACEGCFGRLKTELFYPSNWQSTSIELFIMALDFRVPAGTKKGPEGPVFNRLQNSMELCGAIFGAGNETRTRDPDLGKVVLYQLSYSRVLVMRIL